MDLSDAVREKIKAVSTATLTTVLLKRGLRNVFIRGVYKINPQAPRLVGPAFTLRYIPAREDIDHLGVFADRTHPQRRAIEECPAGCVLVIDSRKDSFAASAGGILITRLFKRGAAGAVTDGGFRDTPDIAVGDSEGVVVISAAMAEEVANEACEQTVFEDFIEERVQAGQSIFGLYPPGATAEFSAWRQQKGEDETVTRH